MAAVPIVVALSAALAAPVTEIISAAPTAQKVYFMESLRVVGNGAKAKLYVADVATKSVTEVPLVNQPVLPPGVSHDYLSGSAICGGVYYAVWTDINNGNGGIDAIHISSGNYTSKRAVAGENTDIIYHTIFCDPNDETKLIAVRSEPVPNRNAEFSVHSVNYWTPGAVLDDTLIAQFGEDPTSTPGGSDGLFGYDPSKNQVWGAFALKKELGGSGTIITVDVSANGNAAVTSYDLPVDQNGYPWVIVPDDGTGTAAGAFYHSTEPGMCCDEHSGLTWKTIELQAGKAKTTDKLGLNPMKTVYTPGMPVPLCGGLLWSNPAADTSNLYGTDPTTLRPTVVIDISKASDDHVPGGFACM